MRAFESRRMRLDLAHCVVIVDLLTAVWTLVVLQVRNRVSLSLEASSPVTANLFDPAASAGRTRCNLKHCRCLSTQIPPLRRVRRFSDLCSLADTPPRVFSRLLSRETKERNHFLVGLSRQSSGLFVADTTYHFNCPDRLGLFHESSPLLVNRSSALCIPAQG